MMGNFSNMRFVGCREVLTLALGYWLVHIANQSFYLISSAMIRDAPCPAATTDRDLNTLHGQSTSERSLLGQDLLEVLDYVEPQRYVSLFVFP